MKKIALLTLAALTLVVAGCGGGNNKAALTLSELCGKQQPLDVSARKIIRVSGKTCVVADKDAVVVARGNAIVAAHGHATVDAAGSVTVIVYNQNVICNIKGYDVTVINSVKSDFLGTGGWMDSSCNGY